MISHLNRILNKLPENVDAVLVTDKINQRWLTNFNFDDGYVLVTRKESYLLTDPRYMELAEKEAKNVTVTLMKEPLSSMFYELLKANDVKTVAFEDHFVTVFEKERLKKLLPDFELVPLGGLLEEERKVKDDEEIENMISAQRIAEKAFDHILDFITPDRTEIDVALELEFFMRQHGAEGTSFNTIAVSGSASSVPHGVPRYKKLEKGFLTMDYGALYKGYCSDMTRTIVLGKADEDMKLLYNTVLKAQTEAEAALKEGVTGKEIDSIARNIIDSTKFKGCFSHNLGHSLGLYIHEDPRVSQMNDQPFKKGNVITIEPGIYVKGLYGCRIEDMAAFRENGVEILTKCPKQLIEL